MRTAPVKQCAGPVTDGRVPLRIIFIMVLSLHGVA